MHTGVFEEFDLAYGCHVLRVRAKVDQQVVGFLGVTTDVGVDMDITHNAILLLGSTTVTRSHSGKACLHGCHELGYVMVSERCRGGQPNDFVGIERVRYQDLS